jgi:hypothetical protein
MRLPPWRIFSRTTISYSRLRVRAWSNARQNIPRTTVSMDPSVDYPGYGRSWPTFQQGYSLTQASQSQGYGPSNGYTGPYNYGYLNSQPPAAIQSYPDQKTLANDHNASFKDPGIVGAESRQKPLDSQSDLPSSGVGLQHFVDINASKTIKDEEHELESSLSNSRWFSERSLKKSHRTMTQDKERGRRTPHMQILQTRIISTLEEDGHETVTLTVNDVPTEKEQNSSECNMRWM